MTTQPITVNHESCKLPTYTQLPLFIFSQNISSDAKMLYLALYHRCITHSLHSQGKYIDDNGEVFVIFSNDNLRNFCALKLSATKRAKKELCDEGLIRTQKICGSRNIRIYPLVPEGTPTYTYKVARNASEGSFDTDSFWNAALKRSLP